MKRPTDRLPALAILIGGVTCFAKFRDSGAGNRLRGQERGACGC
ncbi:MULTISPECIES: hypothetical protein [unclassified Mesorhizobium]|nr:MULTISPECIES: hypothetical protein [unclassified Mesorhizobium]